MAAEHHVLCVCFEKHNATLAALYTVQNAFFGYYNPNHNDLILYYYQLIQ